MIARSLVVMASMLVGIASPVRGQEVLTLARADGQVLRLKPYAPAGTCRGIAILSHGAGGSEDGLAYLAEAMARNGYLAAVIGHQESGRRALRRRIIGSGIRGGLTGLVGDTTAYAGRLMDVAAARQWASARCPGKESVLLGHSMGAATVMIEAGARNSFGVRGVNGFDAYVALSPQGAGLIFPANAWSELRKPVLTITGTRDTELGGSSWETRKEPFANMPPGCKWLAVIAGATHMDLGGRGTSRRAQELAARMVHTFLDGARAGNCAAPPYEPGIDVQVK